MKVLIDKILNDARSEIAASGSLKDLNDARVKFLGKNGEFTAVMKNLKDVPADERPLVGKLVNEAKEKIEKLIAESEKLLSEKELKEKISAETIDITLPGKKSEYGSLHPISLVINEISDIFIGLGFDVTDGPEIETDLYNFEMLNTPKDHPARDMQDTFYISEDIVLRTQTSSMQIRTMLKQKPPIRIINPGKVYRSDFDSSHSPMFHQIEGLVVDKHITLCDLLGLLGEFAKKLFSAETKTRFRPSYFPFTEPSVEVDVTCSECHGKGCPLCKHTGWMEILGAGIVNPKVLENCGIDSNEYSALAFGMGIERIAITRYGISDMRIVFENDKRFLRNYR
ncbi:MAG: phenylalanine--tRNA ligase subunit alpha [Clostridiales bacterium]|jgi:phenylalanyl-tRNA synthetase alpha chain|nr:phenylalanine--tRNA ligase subunit alpha [Clostridiales bacterium]